MLCCLLHLHFVPFFATSTIFLTICQKNCFLNFNEHWPGGVDNCSVCNVYMNILYLFYIGNGVVVHVPGLFEEIRKK